MSTSPILSHVYSYSCLLLPLFFLSSSLSLLPLFFFIPQSNNSDEAEAYAYDNNGALYIIIVNKLSMPLTPFPPLFLPSPPPSPLPLSLPLLSSHPDSSLPLSVTLPTMEEGRVSMYSFSESLSLGPSGTASVANSKFSVTVTGWSATLVVVPSSSSSSSSA